MDEIKTKEIMMPVTVLYEGCRDCERLDITIKTNKLYSGDECLGTENSLRCTYVYECKKYAEMLQKIKEKK